MNDCGCRVEWEAEPFNVIRGRIAAGGVGVAHHIVYCPLHAAAERLAKSLSEITERLRREWRTDMADITPELGLARALLQEIRPRDSAPLPVPTAPIRWDDGREGEVPTRAAVDTLMDSTESVALPPRTCVCGHVSLAHLGTMAAPRGACIWCLCPELTPHD